MLRRLKHVLRVHFELAEVCDETYCLDITKKTSGGVPSHILKLTSDLSFSAVTNLATDMVQKCTFSNEIILADVSPIFKSGDTTLKKAIVPLVSFHHCQNSLSVYC